MATTGKIKLLIVDDSILIRTFLKELFSNHSDFEIIGTAANPYQARDIMRQNWPDVITLDVEMPRMNGIDFLKKIMRSKPTPVVMISTLTKDRAAITLEALEIGAVDYFPKPQGGTWKALGNIREDVLRKVRNAANSNIKKRGLMQETHSVISTVADRARTMNKAVMVGSSTGGVQALTRIFVRLPQTAPGIAVVQHMPPTFVESLADQLEKKTGLTVKVADDNEPLSPGKIVIAPGNHHLEITRRSGIFFTQVKTGEPEGYHMPAVNRLFSSAARIGGPELLGVILTGMGEDGANGLLQMRQNDCRTIGQDRESSVVYGMPRKAFELGAVEQQIALSNISQKIVDFGEGRLK
ncbi:MAG: chemotaxis response regulator protein-glutamate methylesterase [bacterium]|nr:chemotaxis response regulator protein-glutamate methylesterase [bacterium]